MGDLQDAGSTPAISTIFKKGHEMSQEMTTRFDEVKRELEEKFGKFTPEEEAALHLEMFKSAAAHNKDMAEKFESIIRKLIEDFGQLTGKNYLKTRNERRDSAFKIIQEWKHFWMNIT